MSVNNNYTGEDCVMEVKKNIMAVINTTELTFNFENQDYETYTMREQLRKNRIFDTYNPISFYAKILGFYNQSENSEQYSFSDIYNILILFRSTYNISKYNQVYIGIPDETKVSHEKLISCYNTLNEFVALALSIALDYSFDTLNGQNDNFLSLHTNLYRLESLKTLTLNKYIEKILAYLNDILINMRKNANSNKTNLFFLILGEKSLRHFKYVDKPEIVAECVIKCNNTIKAEFENWNKSELLKSEEILISNYSIKKLQEKLKAEKEAKEKKYNSLLKEFNKIKTEYDVIQFVTENTEKLASIYAKGYVNPTNMRERTTIVNIGYNPDREDKEWDCHSRDYISNDDYCGWDDDMARRYLAGAWYETFTTETKLDITIDSLSFSKEFKQN